MAKSVAIKRGPGRGEEDRRKKKTKKIRRFSITRKTKTTACSRENEYDCITAQSTNNIPVYYIMFGK